MKKLILILSIVALMASCSKKQDAKPALTPQNATAKDLAANWLAVTDTLTNTINGQPNTTINGNSNGSHFQFNADGTGLLGTNSPEVTTFTYTVSAGTIVIHIPASANSQETDLDLNILLITTNKLVIRNHPNGTSQEDIGLIKN